MRAFEYASPTTKEQAVALLGEKWGEIEVLAGGTDLLSLMKDDVAQPKRLVDIKEVKELQGIKYAPATGLRLGALVTMQELLENPAIKKEYPALAQAADGITSPQIRNAGTVGGDLCQRPRCWYFRDGMGLLAQDAKGRPLVPEGENRYHAILGNSGPAYFVNPSSLAPALIALGASIRIFGPKGPREVGAGEFFVTPKTNGEREYVLKPNEIVTDILVPPAAGARNATYEVRQREALDWPLAAAAVALKMSGARISSARVVLGHVAPVPWPAPEAEKFLAGKTVSEQVAQDAGASALRGAKALSQNTYKIQLAKVAVKRAILRAAQGRV
ncbi:MAG: xanthine dehydrogenase family protein subunit M [Acidobacteria bacterium]|nr:xanthine dehydrogenase family protein subunit M [Acidobacteriota bacterium]